MFLLSIVGTSLAQMGQQKQRDAEEKYRPLYHFTPQQGWMNDPMGWSI